MTKTKRGWVLAGALALTIGAANAEPRGCYTANVPDPMVLPDGSVHAPGLLRVCTDRLISPVSSLHGSYVDGRPVGMFIGVPREVEERLDRGAAQFIFTRGADAALHLVGYAVGGSDVTTFYEMTRVGSPATRTKRDRLAFRHREEVVVLIASAR